MYEVGKRAVLPARRPHDFSCASCHGEDGKRIRLQDLPNLTKNPGDGIGFAAWPAYRVSSGADVEHAAPPERLLPPAALSRSPASSAT
jgi:mono/diheme cytochrome c family protein